MLEIGNNKINNYNKTDQGFNNKASNISQIYNTNTAIITPGNKDKIAAAIAKKSKIVNATGKKI